MQYSAFMEKSGISEEDIALCVSKNKLQGLNNPNAPFAKKISPAEVMSSGYIASPLKKSEIPPQTDGVSILIVSTEEWAKENKREGISITGVGSAADCYYPGYRDFGASPTARLAAQKALQIAKRKINDIKVAELYDLFSFQEPLLYNEIFNWGYEEIREKLSNGFTAENGKLPVNLSGGILCAHPIFAAGLSRVIHLEKAMRMKGYSCGLAHSQSGLGMQSNISYILEN